MSQEAEEQVGTIVPYLEQLMGKLVGLHRVVEVVGLPMAILAAGQHLREVEVQVVPQTQEVRLGGRLILEVEAAEQVLESQQILQSLVAPVL